jgi:uncharacterized protein YjbI with pentapeptide repeats
MKKRNPYDILLAPELETFTGSLFSEDKYMDTLFEGLDIECSRQIEFNGCVFKRVHFIGEFQKAQFIDCILDHCDFSNTQFQDSRFYRVKLLGCKGIGTNFNKAKWQFVQLEESMLNYSEHSDGTIQDTMIKNCDFSQSSFFTAILQRIKLNKVDFSDADFSDTPLVGLDFSDCIIDRIRVSMNQIKGLTINSEQASMLIRLLGVEVKA